MTYKVAPIDEVELHRLLVERADRLRRVVEGKIPPRFRSLVDSDDVLQEIWIGAFRHVAEFRVDQPDAFDRWLMVITQRKLAEALREASTLRRGNVHRVLRGRCNRQASFADLFGRLASPQKTPSRVVSTQEAADAVQVALGRLSEPFRRAVYLRHIEGRSRAEIARELQRSEVAVNNLLYHGLRELRVLLGDVRRYLSGSPSPASDSA